MQELHSLPMLSTVLTMSRLPAIGVQVVARQIRSTQHREELISGPAVVSQSAVLGRVNQEAPQIQGPWGPVGELELEHPNRVAHMQCDQCDWVSSKPRSMRIHRKVHERVWRQSGLPTRYCHRCGLLLPTSQNGSAHRELCDHFQLGNTVISHGSVDRRRSTRTSESTHRDRVGGSGGGNEAQAAAEATVETEEGYSNDESIQGDASHVRGYGGGSLALPVTMGSEQDSGWQQDDGEVNDSDLFENYGA